MMAGKQKIRNDAMLFERLPNEIFIEILSYMACTDAVIAFCNLNARFQHLLIKCCHSFDFTSISKKNFDIVFQNHDTNRWHALKLSYGDYTPGQVNYFFENYALTNPFSHLRHLSIVKIKPNHSCPFFTPRRCLSLAKVKPDYPYLLFTQLPALSNLVSLEIESSYEDNIPEIDLPNLKKLTISSCLNTSWLKNCIQLETIEYTIPSRCSLDKQLVWPPTLKSLKIIYEDHRDHLFIQNSLTNLTQLMNLEVYQKEPGGTFPRGEIWEQIITESIPTLKNFKFYFQFFCHDRHLDELKQVIASFSTSFYTLEKNCVIRCDVSACHETPIHDDKYGTLNENIRHVILYTVPFSFDIFTIFKTFTKTKISDWSRISMDCRNVNMHTNIKTLIFKSRATPDPLFHHSSISNLMINTTFDALIWRDIFINLQHMTIGDGGILSLENFNILFDHTPHLYSLTVKKSVLKQLTENWSDICICHHLSRKIRLLTFSDGRQPAQSFDRNELEKVLPLFSSKCQHLSLGVHSHNGTIDFILRKMSHLISLHVYVQRKNCPLLNIEWLEQQNTRFNRTNCIITNIRNNHYFWLG